MVHLSLLNSLLYFQKNNAERRSSITSTHVVARVTCWGRIDVPVTWSTTLLVL